MSSTGIPLEAYAFLGAVACFLVILVIFFMYLNKLLCFKDCGGFPCIDSPPKKAAKAGSGGGSKQLSTAYGQHYDEQDTSSDSDDEVLRRYQQSIKRVPSSRSIRSSASHKSARSSRSKHAEGDKLMTNVEKGGKYGVTDSSPNGAAEAGGEGVGGLDPAKMAAAAAVCNIESEAAGSHREGSHREGSHREGSHREGSHREGSHRDVPGSHREDSSPEVHDNAAYTMDMSPTADHSPAAPPPPPGAASLLPPGSPAHSPGESTEQALSAFADTASVSLAGDQDEHLFDVSDLQDREPILISKCGTLEVSFTYNAGRAQMVVSVHLAREIPSKDRGGANNTQVRMLLLPTKKIRHKTKIKLGGNPEFQENFTFKVPIEEVNNMGVRFRLYGCERMRRERMIGESVVGFASINQETVTTHQLTLEPRSNLSHGDSKFDVSSLSRSDSASSTQSMQHGGMPELLLGLTYNGTTGRLSVEVIKGSNFKDMAMNRAPDTYVKLTLMSPNGQEIARSKTSIRRGQPNPLYKETFMFQVAQFQLPDATLMVSVYNKRNMKRKEMIGWFSCGYSNSSDEELAHWTDMRESKGEQVCRWHVLLEP